MTERPIRDEDDWTIPDVTLERYRLDELPVEPRARVAERLAVDEGLGRRLAAIALGDDETMRVMPPSMMARRVLERARHDGPGRWAARLRWTVPLAVSAAVLLVWAGPVAWRQSGSLSPSAQDAAEGVRVKGDSASLAIYRNSEHGTETLHDDDVARPGDLIRVGYRSAGPAYGAILSVDGRGVITFHLPVEGDRAVALEIGETTLLARAFELDDAPRFERFFFVTAAEPFDLAPVIRAAEAEAHNGVAPTLDLPPPLSVITFSLQKEQLP